MSIPRMAKAMAYIDDNLVSGAVNYKRTKKKNSWLKWGAMAACLCLVVGLFANSFIKLSTTQVPLPGGILAEVTELIDNKSCEVVVTGEDSNFSNGDALTIHYNSIRDNSDKADKQLEVGDIIAVTYSDYEEINGTYSISVEYVDLVKPTSGECLELLDNLEGESYSIGNQKKLLTKVAKEKGYTNLVHFLDDGISGVTMDRPGFVDMIQQLEQGKAAAVFVKDLSRLGRNYIEVGRLTEEFFLEHDIRLVAVSDNIDTAEGENEMAPIRNLFNEWYARDISKKRRISNKIKGNAGEPMGQPPYGYMKDPDNPKRWIVDDEAAQVVKRIYGMTMDGMGTEQIAAQLEWDEILTPRAYWLKKGVKRPGKGKQQPPTKWNSSTITKILSLQEYCGDILNFKTYSKSYKNKKRIENDRENWVVFKDVHEPIIDRAVWEQVQQKRGKVRKRRTNEGEKNMFSGLLVCADCGNNLHFHFNQGNPKIKYFNCSNYKGNRGTCTSTHYVRVDFLEQVVLGEIKRLTKFASRYEDDFVKAVMGSTQQNVALDRKLKEKELAALQARDEELDGLFERIYEDNVSGKLSDDRFAKMSRRYEDEQKEISEKIKTLRAEMDKLSSKSVTADMFIATVRKYTRARTLTPRMLNELIDHIEVHQAEKIDGIWEQHLVIHYNCVGAIFIPDVFPLPAPQVSVNTRKGVVVNYAPNQLAV